MHDCSEAVILRLERIWEVEFSSWKTEYGHLAFNFIEPLRSGKTTRII